MSKYTKEHYEDVAKLLAQHISPKDKDLRTRTPVGQGAACLTLDFANLFAADNPPTCQHCGRGKDETHGVCFRRQSYLNHEIKGGFNRERFLAACGLEPDLCGLCGKPSPDGEAHEGCADYEQARADMIPVDDAPEAVEPPHRYG